MNQSPAADGAIREKLEQFIDPYLGQSLGEAKAVKSVSCGDGRVEIELELGFPCADYVPEMGAALQAFLGPEFEQARFELKLSAQITAHAVQRTLKPLTNVKNVVAVASGKGGVGKSTTAANLALAWAAQGAKVGLLDADIYGPSQPLMMGLTGAKPVSTDGKHMAPLRAHGVEVMSIGFMIDPEQPMAWRGPMVTSALSQLLGDTTWGDLDYLVVDMPPGTGDIQLTLAQRVPVSGAVIVTTPQDIALLDARKGLKMFEKVEVRVLGIVENMSMHICSQCGHVEHVFGSGGGARMAAQYGVQLLGELPLDIRIREDADGGSPTVAAEPGSERARAYFLMARRTAARLATLNKDYSRAFPKITVEAT
ncbi:MAG TPA: iron-sulfur cluster carrier protein ApbC [Steroidobacteraceae bacterium]|jgi:ATP-binding protein involved in chromosome partitioning|nr:iron-sulfur cluster carrier protein ApbC [Steroidobacteraceae bacterium]